jgi:hypothetical protein
MNMLRRHYGRARAKHPYTWTVGWTLSGVSKRERTKGHKSEKAANAERDWLIRHGYKARAFKWYHEPPHERG